MTDCTWRILYHLQAVFARLMNGPRKDYTERGNSDPQRKTPHILFYLRFIGPNLQMDVNLSPPHQRSFSSQQMESFAENHSWIQCRDQGEPSFNGYIYSTTHASMAQGTLQVAVKRLEELEYQNTKSLLWNGFFKKWLHKQGWNRVNINRDAKTNKGNITRSHP